VAPGLTGAATAAEPASPVGLRQDPVRLLLLVGSLALLLLVGLSRPNAAQPDLAPRGWAPGALVPLTLTPAVVTGVLWAGYLLGAAAVWRGLRTTPAGLRSWAWPAVLAVLALLTAPFGSADHVNYLAYGRILDQGGDPWLASPGTWAGGLDPVTSRVEAPWTEEPSIYGPFATLLHGLSAAVGGPNLRQGVWVWQVLVVLAWLGVRAVLRRGLPRASHGRVDVLWTLNPLVLGVGVLGAHVDVVATVLAVAAAVLAGRACGVGADTGSRAGALLLAAFGAGALAGLALATKVTYGVVLAGVLAAWWLAVRHSPDRRRPRWPDVASLAAGVLAVAVPLHVWAGPHVYDQLRRSRQAVSLATPWRLVLDALGPLLGSGPTRTLIGLGAAVVAVVLGVLLLRLSRPAPGAVPAAPPVAVALWVTACLSLAYSLAAPYSLPWYDVLAWGCLPALVPGVVDLVALGRMLVMACAYVPGRVLGMTPTVETVTLGFRRYVAPWLGVVLWAVVIRAGGRRGSPPSPATRPAGGTAPPTR
jgi:hypothetical protein